MPHSLIANYFIPEQKKLGLGLLFLFFINIFYMCCRKRQTNVAAGGINSDDLKTFTVPCNIDVQLDKAMVK